MAERGAPSLMQVVIPDRRKAIANPSRIHPALTIIAMSDQKWTLRL